MTILKWFLQPRFSLRCMLIVLTVACLLLGWQIEQRRRLMIAAEQLWNTPGCNLDSFGSYEHGSEFESAELVTRFWDPQVLPSIVVACFVRDENTVAALSKLTTIEKLILEGDDVCDEWIRHLESLQRLRRLYMNAPKLTDRVIPVLSKLRQLEDINLGPNQMTAAGYLRLRRALPDSEFTIYVKLGEAPERFLPLSHHPVGTTTP